MNWTLQTVDGDAEDVNDSAQLRRRLIELDERAKDQPFFAILGAPDGSCLAIGLGRHRCVLSYTAPGGLSAKHSVGNVENKGMLSYGFLGHFTEVPSQYALPRDEAFDAALEFFKQGRLPDPPQWDED